MNKSTKDTSIVPEHKNTPEHKNSSGVLKMTK